MEPHVDHQTDPHTNEENRHVCVFCRDGLKHPLFVYIAYDRRTPIRKINKKQQLHFSSSSSPFHDIECQKRTAGYRPGWKSTKAIAPYLKLYLFVRIYTRKKHYKNLYKRMKFITYETILNLFIFIANEQNTILNTEDGNLFQTPVLSPSM